MSKNVLTDDDIAAWNTDTWKAIGGALSLRDWVNKDEAGTRFPPSRHKCPQCGGATLADNWPPNYGGGASMYLGDGNVVHTFYGSQKCVCLVCKIAFVHSYRMDGGEYQGDAHNITPLVERDGFLLTPHDVWREDYKVEHGEYPREAYR